MYKAAEETLFATAMDIQVSPSTVVYIILERQIGFSSSTGMSIGTLRISVSPLRLHYLLIVLRMDL
jgi:hypothetical protein